VSALPANPNALELILFYVPVANIEVSMFGGIRLSRSTASSTVLSATSASPLPVDTWVCLLWSVTRATTATGQVALAGDIGPVIRDDVQTDSVPGLGALSVGLHWFGSNLTATQPAYELWIDDILIDDAPLTCFE
jgi:hypothetical protein